MELTSFGALLLAVSHSIRIGFEGSKLKIVDQKAFDGRVSQKLKWLSISVLIVGLESQRAKPAMSGLPNSGISCALYCRLQLTNVMPQQLEFFTGRKPPQAPIFAYVKDATATRLLTLH